MSNINAPKILIAMPAFGGKISEKTTVSLFKTAQAFTNAGIRHSLLTVANESLISRGRSRLFNFFYNCTDCDFLIFIDADIGFVPEDIIKLLELNVPFSCAGVPLKSLDPMYNFGVLEDQNGNLIVNNQKNALKVEYVGTAFMMIHRSVHEQMAVHYPELKIMPSATHTNMSPSDQEINNSFHFFQEAIDEKGSIRSEDYAFCDRWTKIGGEIWLRPDINLTHEGSHIFEGLDLTSIFKLNQ